MVLGAHEFAQNAAAVAAARAPPRRRRELSLGGSRSANSLQAGSQQVLSTMVGAPKFSWGPGYGAQKHRKGKLGVEVVDARHPEYVHGLTDAPGVGAYDLQSCFGRQDRQTGHPECHRPPGYSFSRELKHPDRRTLRLTDLSHLGHDGGSHLDVVGPGRYGGQVGLAEKRPLLTTMPSYTMRQRCDRLTRSASEPGPFEYGIAMKTKVLQRVQPEFSVFKGSRGERDEKAQRFGTSDDIGPGSYSHATSFVAQTTKF